MSMETSRTPLLDDLRQQLAQRQVIVIVGAGVSMAATNGAETASWLGLLRSGVARVEAVGQEVKAGWADRQRASIAGGDLDELLGVAENIARKLHAPRGGEYQRWLRESVGSLAVTDRTVIEALVALGAPICSTNYDGLLESVSGLAPVTWRDPSRCERVLRGDEHAIIHLHGHYLEPESVVLGLRSYEAVLGNEPAQALLRALRTYKTLLFVGYGAGLADPNFAAFLTWCERVFPESQYRHFRLARDSDVLDIQAAHGPAQRLFVLGYGPDYADLAPFLRCLVVADAGAQRSGNTAIAVSMGPSERALVDSVAAYRAHIARSPRIQRVRFADLASRAEDRDRPRGFERLPLFILPKLEQISRHRESAAAGEQPPRLVAPEGGSNVRTLLQVLAEPDQRLFLIVGGPGLGKTELGLWLLAKLCTPGESVPELPSNWIPLRIEMRQFDHDAQQNGPGFDFVAYVEQTLHALSVPLDATQIRALHQAGRLLWIFDGMDEVRQLECREHYAEMILSLLRHSPSRAIVTSRTVGCEPLVDALDSCAVWALHEFDDAQIETFLGQWYRLEFADEHEIGEKRRHRLAQVIKQSRTVRDLCRNPLLLTLLALLNRGDELPRRRHKVFERALDLMAAQWDVNKHLPEAQGPAAIFEREDKLQFLRQLAWAIQNNRWPNSQNNLVQRDDLFRFTVEFVQKQLSIDEDRAKVRARALIDDLEERNYTLAYLGNDQYGFVHKSFLEYLAAEALIRTLTPAEQVELFVSAVDGQNSRSEGAPAWWEVLTLACGLLDDQEQSAQILRILQALLARLDQYSAQSRNARQRYYAFTIRCLAEVRKVQQEPIRSLVLGVMRLFHQDTLSIVRSGFGWWLDTDIIEALRVFGPRWPEPDAWLHWARSLDWKRIDKHMSSHLLAAVSRCVLASASPDQRVRILTVLLDQDTDGLTAMYALEEASLLGPWTQEEALLLATAMGSASENVQVQVGCHFAKTVSPAMVRLLLQSPLPERIKLYLARDSVSSLDLTVKDLALRTLYELSSSPSERIRDFAVRWLTPEGLDYVDVRDQFEKLATTDPSERVRYGAARALTYTDKRDWAFEQLLQLQQSKDPVVLSWLAHGLGNFPSYRALARTLWIRLSGSNERHDQAEALAALARSYLDDETKELITQALRKAPELAVGLGEHDLSSQILFGGNDDHDLKIVTLEALLTSPYYQFLHGSLSPYHSRQPQETEFCNAYFRSLLTKTLSDHKRLLAARWLYYAEQNPTAHDELLALARGSSDVAVRLEAAEVVSDPVSALELARSAEDLKDRKAALGKLCWMAKDNPSLRPPVLEIARSDKSPSVRMQAARFLQRSTASPEEQEMGLRVLHELARQNSDEAVQLDAAQQLALYPVLVQLAEAAQDEKIRQRAADTLALLDIRADILQLGLAHHRRGRVYLSSQAVGTIEETAQGSRFFYDSAWLRRRDAEPISLTMPLRPEPYDSVGLHPFFENLLPEGSYLDLVAKKTNVARSDEFGLLLATCGDCAGAVEVRPLVGSE